MTIPCDNAHGDCWGFITYPTINMDVVFPSYTVNLGIFCSVPTFVQLYLLPFSYYIIETPLNDTALCLFILPTLSLGCKCQQFLPRIYLLPYHFFVPSMLDSFFVDCLVSLLQSCLRVYSSFMLSLSSSQSPPTPYLKSYPSHFPILGGFLTLLPRGISADDVILHKIMVVNPSLLSLIFRLNYVSLVNPQINPHKLD